MKVALYIPQGTNKAAELQRLAELPVKDVSIWVCHTVESLESLLRQPAEGPGLAVLMPSSHEDLNRLIKVGWMLQSARVIVILPDRLNNTITQGHLLRPSFLTFDDCDLKEVGAVMRNILKHNAAH